MVAWPESGGLGLVPSATCWWGALRLASVSPSAAIADDFADVTGGFGAYHGARPGAPPPGHAHTHHPSVSECSIRIAAALWPRSRMDRADERAECSLDGKPIEGGQSVTEVEVGAGLWLRGILHSGDVRSDGGAVEGLSWAPTADGSGVAASDIYNIAGGAPRQIVSPSRGRGD